MAAKEISVKKYVVRLSGEERERLEMLIRKGKSPARRVLKARILLKAVSEAGKGWSDNRIIEALETSPSMVYRVRKQLVEEGFEAVLSRKPRAMPAVARIFDGEKEAKLIALACSKLPKGRARWTLRLLENNEPAETPANCGLFLRDRETSVRIGVRGGGCSPHPTCLIRQIPQITGKILGISHRCAGNFSVRLWSCSRIKPRNRIAGLRSTSSRRTVVTRAPIRASK